MIPSLNTFFSLRHVKGKQVHYHCKIPPGYAHLPVKAKGNDGVFAKIRGGNESTICLTSLKSPIDLEARESELLRQQEGVAVSLVEAGNAPNNKNFYLIKARHIGADDVLILSTYILAHERFYIEITFGSKEQFYALNERDYFNVLDSLELHETIG